MRPLTPPALATALLLSLVATPLAAQDEPLADASATGAEATAGDDTPADPSAGPGVADLKVELRPSEGVTVGDRVSAELVLVWMGPEPSDEPRFPAWQESWGKAEVMEVGEVEGFVDQSGRRIYRQTVALTAFQTGEVKLPPVTVAVPLTDNTRELRTPADLAFTVVSVLPEESAADPNAAPAPAAPGQAAPAREALEPRPPAPPEPLQASAAFRWSTGVLATCCMLASLLLLRRLGAQVERVATVPRLAPLAELLQRLGELDPGAGSEPVHTRLSLALRDFLGRSLGIQALESTTSEVNRRLRSTQVPPALAQRTVRLLQDCDQVKFARLEVDPSTIDDRVARAQALAREIDGLLAAARIATASENAEGGAVGAPQGPTLGLPASGLAGVKTQAAGARASSVPAPAAPGPGPASPAGPQSVNVGGGFVRTEDGQLIAGGR